LHRVRVTIEVLGEGYEDIPPAVLLLDGFHIEGHRPIHVVREFGDKATKLVPAESWTYKMEGTGNPA